MPAQHMMPHSHSFGPSQHTFNQPNMAQHQQQHALSTQGSNRWAGGRGQGSGPSNQRGNNKFNPRGPQGGFVNSPGKASHALVPKGPINLITNNFKIKSSNQGIIYTYAVEFIDGEATNVMPMP